VRRDQLLLLAQGAHEAERVRAEPHDRHERQQRKRSNCARGHTPAFAPARGSEHHEREHQPGGGLHADSDHEHGGCGAEIASFIRRSGCSQRLPGHIHSRVQPSPATASGRGRREREPCRQREQHERVVVRAAGGQLEQHGIQADEHRRHPRRAAHPARGACRECDGSQAGRHGNCLERPQSTGQAQGGQCIGSERKQGPVGRMLEGPADEGKSGIGGSFGRHMGIGVQAVQGSEACE